MTMQSDLKRTAETVQSTAVRLLAEYGQQQQVAILGQETNQAVKEATERRTTTEFLQATNYMAKWTNDYDQNEERHCGSYAAHTAT